MRPRFLQILTVCGCQAICLAAGLWVQSQLLNATAAQSGGSTATPAGWERPLIFVLTFLWVAGLQAVVASQDLLKTAHNRRPLYSTSRSRRLVLASSTSSLPPPDRTVLVAYRVKPLTSP